MIDSAAFTAPKMEAHFQEFSSWLGQEVGAHKAAISIHRYLEFFLEIEKQWRVIPEYAVLLKHFDTQRLRKVLLPMRWMEESKLVVPDALAKAENSDRRRILATLQKADRPTRQRKLLEGYYDRLLISLKADSTTWRSMRLAMTPALALLSQGEALGIIPPDQKVLETYLRKTPGQRAAVSGFVRYLRDEHSIEITLPAITTRSKIIRRKKLEAELTQLLLDKDTSKGGRHKLLTVAMVYFHGVPRKAITQTVVDLAVNTSGSAGVNVVIDEKTYWLPDEFRLEATSLRPT